MDLASKCAEAAKQETRMQGSRDKTRSIRVEVANSRRNEASGLVRLHQN